MHNRKYKSTSYCKCIAGLSFTVSLTKCFFIRSTCIRRFCRYSHRAQSKRLREILESRVWFPFGIAGGQGRDTRESNCLPCRSWWQRLRIRHHPWPHNIHLSSHTLETGCSRKDQEPRWRGHIQSEWGTFAQSVCQKKGKLSVVKRHSHTIPEVWQSNLLRSLHQKWSLTVRGQNTWSSGFSPLRREMELLLKSCLQTVTIQAAWGFQAAFLFPAFLIVFSVWAAEKRPLWR